MSNSFFDGKSKLYFDLTDLIIDPNLPEPPVKTIFFSLISIFYYHN